MGRYLFQNGNVYVSCDGTAECMPLDEFAGSSMAHDMQAHLLVAETDGPLFMDHLRRIRSIFPRQGIRTCASYAAALRSFLQARGLVAAGESCLVADDLGDKFLLTASRDHQTALTRTILSRDPGKIVDEIRRTQKSVMEKDSPLPRGPVFRILSNNADVLEALDPERRKEALFFEGSFPVFEVLGKTRFSVQLMTPEELVFQKKRAVRRGLIAACLAAACAAGAGCLFFLWVHIQESREIRRMSVLMRDKAALEQEEKGLSAKTYQDRLKTMPRVSFFRVFVQFLQCLPPQALIERVSLQRQADMRWVFTGFVSFPQKEIFPFVCDDTFQRGKVEHVFVQTKPGMKISLMLPDGKREDMLP